ncbi:hypothetical protein F8M41_002349 [Gigaspora margarita]|uniref:Uncharacterized protein n=1 Tax=Gigaspora margarita TaxID=4874 RepID=A0A8H4EVI5_GIGMA|nr:hypothetical protein F8M41_002349 [Gigaspora margarita]
MVAILVPKWPKLTAFRDHIGEFDGDTKHYRPWRNQLENAFKIFNIVDLMVYDRYSGNFEVGYELRAQDYDLSAVNAHPCRWTTEFIMMVLAIVRTKLKGTALEIYDSKIATINCYWRPNVNNNTANMKDTHNYPTTLNRAYRALHQSATTEGERCTPHITRATVIKGFRDVFDDAFLVDAIQQTAQKDF